MKQLYHNREFMSFDITCFKQFSFMLVFVCACWRLCFGWILGFQESILESLNANAFNPSSSAGGWVAEHHWGRAEEFGRRAEDHHGRDQERLWRWQRWGVRGHGYRLICGMHALHFPFILPFLGKECICLYFRMLDKQTLCCFVRILHLFFLQDVDVTFLLVLCFLTFKEK